MDDTPRASRNAVGGTRGGRFPLVGVAELGDSRSGPGEESHVTRDGAPGSDGDGRLRTAPDRRR